VNGTALKTRLENKVKTLQIEPAIGKVTYITETTLPTINSSYVALTTNALGIISENLKNQPISHQLFDVIKSPTGGTTAFTVPTMAGDEIQKELTGIILDYNTPRAYWASTDPVEGTPPNCYSSDSLISNEGKPCVRCVYNEFGSKNGESNAKACKESVEIYLLRQDNIMPIIIRVPVTSKWIFQRYMTRLAGRLIPLYGVVTRITLEKTTSKAGQAYAQFNFEAINVLSPEETNNARVFGQKFTEILNVADEQEIKDVV